MQTRLLRAVFVPVEPHRRTNALDAHDDGIVPRDTG